MTTDFLSTSPIGNDDVKQNTVTDSKKAEGFKTGSCEQ